MQKKGPLAAQEFALKPLFFKRGVLRRTTPIIVQKRLPRKIFNTPEATAGKTLGLLGRLESVAAVVARLVALFILMVVGSVPGAVVIPGKPLGLCRRSRGAPWVLVRGWSADVLRPDIMAFAPHLIMVTPT